MRLAWFTPLPPVTSGIADYSAELLPVLAGRHRVDTYVASPAETAWAASAWERQPSLTAASAHEFVWRQHRDPYDLVVFQLGNAWCHDYMWPYVFQYPGLVVLHDAHLHHARAWSLLRRKRTDEYQAELAFNHPDVPPEAAAIGLSGFSGPLYYFWPMLRTTVQSAKVVAVHAHGLAAALGEQWPDTTIAPIRMGVADPLSTLGPGGAAAARARVRDRHGIPAEALVCAAYGAVTPEKRIAEILRAVARTRAYRPDIRLLLVGKALAHYDAAADAAALGIEDRVTITGFVPEAELPSYLVAADLALGLRWPTAQETSASWLRAVAAGLPTVITDLAHQADLPTLDPRTWTVAHTSPTLEAPSPVAIAIDILDEEHSLGLALRRLSTDADLRRELGSHARRFFEAGHGLSHMAEDYERVLQLARDASVPAPSLPAHLRPDPLRLARQLVEPLGLQLGWHEPSR